MVARTRHYLIAMALLLVIGGGGLIAPQDCNASISRRWIQGKDSNWHYGVSSYIYVEQVPVGFTHPAIEGQVTALWAYTTNEANFIEAGHTRDSYSIGTGAYAFYQICRDYNLGYPIWLGDVPTSSTQRYHIGYSPPSGYHYVWWNNEVVWQGTMSQMTSSWPGTNTELAYDPNLMDDLYHENTGHYWSLKYKTYDWGVWNPFANVQKYEDNDGYHAFNRQSATEHNVIADYY